MDEYIGKEVFFIIDSENDDIGDVKSAGGWAAVLEELKDLSPSTDAETRVFHGVLTAAEFLPKSFHGKSVFVICMHPIRKNRGCIAEAVDETPEQLAKAIANLINNGNPFPDAEISIDDVFVLYGYQIQVCLSIKDEDIDEEIIEVGKQISNETEKVGEACREKSMKRYVNEYGVINMYGGDWDD